MNPLITIIVPIYHTERFLPKCLDSICGQTYKKLQIILIDDGSPDHCGEICDEYAAKDSRIQVIHQRNGGVVRAREAGIALATGEYIAFVDSDDWIEPDMYERMLELGTAGDYDIVWCDVYVESYEVSVYKTYYDPHPEFILKAIMRRKAQAWIWNKLIKTSFWKKCSIYADPSNTICEDELMTTQILINNPSMTICRVPLYHYIKWNTTSQLTLALKNDDYLLQGLHNWIHIKKVLEDHYLFSIYEKNYYGRIVWYKGLLLLKGHVKYVQEILPEANHYKYISSMKVSKAAQLLFYAVLNGKMFGRLLWKLYSKYKKRCIDL